MPNLEYSDGDMHEILKRAAAIDGNANLSRSVLEQTASELGISREALERAEAEYSKERESLAEMDDFLRAKRVEFSQHLASYVSVNLFLIFIWWFTGHGYPWFMWPLMGWGIGMFGHWIHARTKSGSEFDREFKRWRKKRAKG